MLLNDHILYLNFIRVFHHLEFFIIHEVYFPDENVKNVEAQSLFGSVDVFSYKFIHCLFKLGNTDHVFFDISCLLYLVKQLILHIRLHNKQPMIIFEIEVVVHLNYFLELFYFFA